MRRAALPEAEAMYPPDQLTDRDERFFAAELLREKIYEEMGQELPYRCEVVIDSFKEDGRLRRIEATILVEREPEADPARRRRRAPEAHGERRAQGYGKALRRQGLPRHVGQGAQSLDPTTPACCANSAIGEEGGPPGGHVLHTYPYKETESHRRGVHAQFRASGPARARCATAALGDARRAARLSSAASGLERIGGARKSNVREMVRRATARSPDAN